MRKTTLFHDLCQGIITFVVFCCLGFLSEQTVVGQNVNPRPAREADTLSKDAAPGSGLGTVNERKPFTGIAKPAPGEKRMVPGTVERPTDPIPGTTVHRVNSSAWLRSAPYILLGPAVSQPVHRHSPDCTDCFYSIQDQVGQDTSLSGGTIEKVPTLAPPQDGVTTELLASEMSGFAMDDTLGPYPRPTGSAPVAADPTKPREPNLFFPPIGPPRTLRYGMVTDPSIWNTPYAPGSAAAKVFSNGREVTMTERAQGAEGYAPVVRWLEMAHHTNVATSLSHYCDGLEHCPVCMRPYLCGCDKEDCRFCNPEMRVGPSPVCDCCGEKRPCIHGFKCKGQLGHAPYREWGNTSGGIACPICKMAVESVPCGCCENCLNAETCIHYKPCGQCPSCLVFEKCDLYKAHRNCVLPNKTNSCNRCDLTINGEPCGSCDWCRENSGLNHELCGHQEVGLLHKKTVYNPYNENPLFSAPPRFITDRFTNRASKFPIYYNPAPYYKETSNPSTWGAFQRPYTFRWTCELCKHDPCTCTAPGNAGQVAFAYACKFCDRNPCACTAEICNANAPLNPKAVHAQLDEMAEAEKQQKASSPALSGRTDSSSQPITPAQDSVWQTGPAPLSNTTQSTTSPSNWAAPPSQRPGEVQGTPSPFQDSSQRGTWPEDVSFTGPATNNTVQKNGEERSQKNGQPRIPVNIPAQQDDSFFDFPDISQDTNQIDPSGQPDTGNTPLPKSTNDPSDPFTNPGTINTDFNTGYSLPVPDLRFDIPGGTSRPSTSGTDRFVPTLPGENLARPSNTTNRPSTTDGRSSAPTGLSAPGTNMLPPNQNSTPLGTGGRSLEGPQGGRNQINPIQTPSLNEPGTMKKSPNQSKFGSVSHLRSNMNR